MAGGASLRRVVYKGKDQDADQAFRSVSDILSFLQKLPTTDGTLLENVDIPGTGADRTWNLDHHMGRKARGVCVMSCKPRDQTSPSHPAKSPVHLPSKDTSDTAVISLAAGLADDFIYSFWVW